MSAAKRTAAPVSDDSAALISSATFTIPSTAVVGDIVVFAMGQGTGINTFTAPTGWTPAAASQVVTNSNLSTQVWMKKLEAGEPGTSVTFTSSGGARLVAAYIVVSGATNVADIKVATPVSTASASSAAMTLPTVTTTEADNFIVGVAFGRAAVTTPLALSPGTGLTEDAEGNTNFATSPNLAVGIYHPANSGAAGSYGGQSVNVSQTTTSTHRYTLAIPSVTAPPQVGDVGMRVRVIKEDGSLVTVNVYAVLSDGTLRQVSDPV